MDLEENLTLSELLEIYETTVERQTRTIQAYASMMGAGSGMAFGGNSIDSNTNNVVVYGEEDIARVPFGLGYETA